MYFFQDVVEVALDVQIHGHEPISGVEVAPLQSFMLRGGVIDNPVVAGALGVVPKNVLQKQADCQGQALGVSVYKAVKLGWVHTWGYEMHLGLYF